MEEKDNKLEGLEEGNTIPSPAPNNIDPLIEKIDSLIGEIKIDRERELEKEKLLKEEQKKQSELDKKQEKEDKKIQETEKKKLEEDQKKQEELENKFTTLVENSDLQTTLTYQESVLIKLDELILQNKINYIFGGLIISMGVVMIFQKHLTRK